MDSIYAADPITITSAEASKGTTSTISSGTDLDEADFLMLLINELMNQDPLDPMNDREFISQLAQLDTLNETIELNENLRAMQMLQATSLVGRNVEAIGPTGQRVQGVVSEVLFVDSVPMLVVDDSLVNLDDVVRIF